MGNGRSGGVVGKILERVEDRVEDWREQDTARKVKAEQDRDQRWEEATERERILAEEMKEQESQEAPPVGSSGQRQRITYVLHSKEMGQTLQEFAEDRQRLVNVVAGRGDFPGEADVEGSWLVFEEDE